MAKTDEIESYGALKQIAPDLYAMEGEWRGAIFGRRMTVIRLKSKDLIIHSAIRLNNEDYRQIDELGNVKYIVVPNVLHKSEAHFYAERYPTATVLAAVGARKRLQKITHVDGILPDDWPQEVREEIGCVELEGTRFLNESVFFHRPSRTLVATDSIFNMQDDVGGMTKVIFSINQIYKKFGPSRIFRTLVIKDKHKLRVSLQKIFAWDFDRVILSHGQILETGGKTAVIEAFNFLTARVRWKLFIIALAALAFDGYQFKAIKNYKLTAAKNENESKLKDEEIQKLGNQINIKNLEIETISGRLAERDLENKRLLEKKNKKPAIVKKKKRKTNS